VPRWDKLAAFNASGDEFKNGEKFSRYLFITSYVGIVEWGICIARKRA
jgi:hypothetical protein